MLKIPDTQISISQRHASGEDTQLLFAAKNQSRLLSRGKSPHLQSPKTLIFCTILSNYTVKTNLTPSAASATMEGL
jgi:hypothetical protein